MRQATSAVPLVTHLLRSNFPRASSSIEKCVVVIFLASMKGEQISSILSVPDHGAGMQNEATIQGDGISDDKGSIVYLEGIRFFMLAALWVQPSFLPNLSSA